MNGIFRISIEIKCTGGIFSTSIMKKAKKGNNLFELFFAESFVALRKTQATGKTVER